MDPRRRSPPPGAKKAPAESSASVQEGETSALSKTIATQLASGQYECMICTDVIGIRAATWSCFRCFRIFHIGCTKKWADTSSSGQGDQFRCPSCQYNHGSRPKKYYCFCGKTVDPDPRGFGTPHSCGEVCGKQRLNDCPHPCSQLCHPGPCPDCQARVQPRPCPCGKTMYDYQCGHHDPNTTCSSDCGKLLNCGFHRCEKKCHHGPCDPCTAEADLPCVCGKHSNTLRCGSDKWSCGIPCGKTQRCGNHQCNVLCHTGQCPPCDDDPQLVVTCPCGKQPLPKPRESCLDPVPLCGNICDKVLLCGTHRCTLPCHHGPCPECNSKIQLRCPCNASTRKVPCKDASHFRCSQKCKTKLSCGRHECDVLCCTKKGDTTAAVHRCQRHCNKQLECGHTCDEPCHRGQCPKCHHIVTTELTCRCGREVLYPPQPCGTEPPTCYAICEIPQPCGHTPIPHNCHYGSCPPCMRTVVRRCVGDHVDVSAVLCSVTNVTCSNPCGKTLPCGHLCTRKCHAGPCADEKKKTCGQTCNRAYPCGHHCSAKCHGERACTACSTKVEICCECGASTQIVSCKVYQQRRQEMLDKDLGSALRDNEAPVESTTADLAQAVTFPCTDDCVYQRRLAALQSVGGGKQPAVGGSSGRKTFYSLRIWAIGKRDVDSVASIEKQLATFLKSGERNLMLPAMPREKRLVVHELCWYYHIDSEAVDKEPNRSCYLSKTPKTAVPNPLLSKAVYDDNENPNAIALKILKNHGEATHKTLVVDAEALNDMIIQRVLKQFAGQLIIVPHESKESTFFIVFPWGTEMSSAYSFLRRQAGVPPFSYYRYGDEPATKSKPTGSSSSPPPQQVSPVATTANTAKAAQSSWASMMRQSKKKGQDKDAVETKNAFSALSGGSGQPRK